MRRLYACGSGDGLFWMVEVAIRKAMESTYPRVNVEAERPHTRRRVMKLHHAVGGPPDVLVDDPRAARLLRNRGQASPVERPSILRGYEDGGEPIGEDD
jgi:hypothetical protein